MKITVERILYLLGIASLFTLAGYSLFKMIFLPLAYHMIWLVLASLYMMIPQFKSLIQAVNFWVYCKICYENRIFWGLFYDMTTWVFPHKIFNQINYGYAPLNKEGNLLDLTSEYEAERMALQLYYRTVTGMDTVKDLTGKTILEISSGRAGGLQWISRTFNVKKCIGLDLSTSSVKWCQETYQDNEKLEFTVGNAETFVEQGVIKPNSVDIIISVDSAHLYPHFSQFIDQCQKALKPNGHFFISDFMEKNKYSVNEATMKDQSGLKLVKKEVTSENIMHAMALDGERRNKLVIEHSPLILRPFFLWNSGAKGSRIYKLLQSGEFIGTTWSWQKAH